LAVAEAAAKLMPDASAKAGVAVLKARVAPCFNSLHALILAACSLDVDSDSGSELEFAGGFDASDEEN
jgi:hypothetical protein